MAVTVIRRAHAGRATQIARHNAGRRYANISYPPLVARDSTTPVVITEVPTDSKALVGTFVFVGFFVFIATALIVWRYKSKKSAQRQSLRPLISKTSNFDEKSSYLFEKASFGSDSIIEKPKEALTRDPSTPASGRWQPQLRADIVLPEPKTPRSAKAKKNWEKNLAKFITGSKKSTSTPKASSDLPGYAYLVKNDSEVSVTRVMPPIPEAAFAVAAPMPPTPMKPSSGENDPETPDSKSHLLSPRSSSFAAQVNQALSSKMTTGGAKKSSNTATSDSKVPRLMSVTTTFTPTMSDELAITVGETVRLIEEYADEWCLVQRIGKDEKKGVIPRFCLSERQISVTRLPIGVRKPSA